MKQSKCIGAYFCVEQWENEDHYLLDLMLKKKRGLDM